MSKKWNLQDIRPLTATANTRQQIVSRTSSQPNSNVSGSQTTDRKTMTGIKIPNSKLDNDIPVGGYNDLANITMTPKDKKGRRLILWAIGVFCISIISAFSIGALTSGAEITIYPKVRSMNINTEFIAYKEKRPNELSYEILTLEATGERQVTATGQEEVSIQVVGEIDIYKTTPGTERLIKNTRFSTADGKIFRLQESVVINGAVKAGDGTLQPGITRAEVFADEAGETYNIPAQTHLTVPAFKEKNLTELYVSIFAKNPNNFTGGYKGPKFIINEDELATAKKSLQLELENTLKARVTSEKPANYNIFDQSISVTYNSLPAVQSGDSLVTIKEQATLQVPLFNTQDFASFVASEIIADYQTTEKVRLDNVNEITFSYKIASTTDQNIANFDQLNFRIVGQPVIVWEYDEEALKTALVGKNKSALPVALGQYSQDSRSTLKIRPFWKKSFPDNINKIKILEVLEQPSGENH